MMFLEILRISRNLSEVNSVFASLHIFGRNRTNHMHAVNTLETQPLHNFNGLQYLVA